MSAEKINPEYVRDKVFRILFHEIEPVSIKSLAVLAMPEKILEAAVLRDIIAEDSRFLSDDMVYWELAPECYEEAVSSLPDEVIVTDIESTGSLAGHDRIIEIAACRIREGEITDEFHTTVNPGIPISKSIIRLTGLRPSDLEDKPTIEEVMPEFLKFWGRAVFCAHDADFDLNFICSEVQRLGLEYQYGVPEICSLRLAQRLLPGLPTLGLKGLSKHFGYDFSENHKALEDARAASFFLDRFSKMAVQQNLPSVRQLVETQRKKLGRSKLNSLAKRRLRKLRQRSHFNAH